jgi:GDP-L-fucose synthase
MNKDDVIYVAGHGGLVGSAILRLLREWGFQNILTRTHGELDLTRQEQVEQFFEAHRPAYVFLAAAKVGGIGANSSFPAQFIYDNLSIALNVIHCAWRFGTRKLLNLGSSCIYPRLAPQPLKEEYLLTGPLEPTNEAYAVAKISAIKLCLHYNHQYGTDFFSLMPTNLYGPNDNFDFDGSHVLPALIRKLHIAKLLSMRDFEGIRKDLYHWGSGLDRGAESNGDIAMRLKEYGISADQVTLWGTGTPRREFLHVNDLADACLLSMQMPHIVGIGEFMNVGMGKDISIAELAQMICRVVGYEGDVVFDTTKPDGTPRKLLDVSRIFELGWRPRIALQEGIARTYLWYLETSGNKTPIAKDSR